MNVGLENWQISTGAMVSFCARAALTIVCALDLVGCAEPGDDTTSNSAPIPAYCPYLPSKTFSGGITVTGTARYEFRINGNGAVTSTPNPIRYAELKVTDSAGTIVQCAETSSTGTFSFQLPNDGASYKVEVLARSKNTHNTAYVMNNPTANVAWSISSTVIASGSPNLQLTALATGDLVGGAFNILDQILNAQDYLRTKTANCDQSGTTNYYADCVPFPGNANVAVAGTGMAPLVNVYWTPGVTPSTYYGGTGAISFYGSLDGTDSKRGLYILGGVNGDTTRSDMDHFDNSVIIHEYGHFLEYAYSRMDSPGGSHNGDDIIDARLAWSEAWSDFFQGVVIGTGIYRDTYGRSGCGTNCTGLSFYEDLNLDPSTVNTATCGGDCHDVATAVGEGNFREFSIARLLWNAAKTGGTSKFAEVWTLFSGRSNGMKSISDRFKSVGRLHLMQQALAGGANWSTLRSNEKHAGDLSGYATPIRSTGCGSTLQSMSIKRRSTDDTSFARSDQFGNNDFFYYSHPGGAFTAGISWGGGGNADLDLYIYKQGYTFGNQNTMATFSNQDSSTSTGSESVSHTLAAGNYIINVMAHTGLYSVGGTSSTNYTLTVNGSAVCTAPNGP